MADVFISYSRQNNPFAKRLIEQLALKGKDAWVDWEGIPLTAPNWWEEIKAGIEGADSFVFVMSPDSMASVVCNMELDYAFELKKRIIPVMYQELESSEALASIADFEPDQAMEERLSGKDPLIISQNNWQYLSHINWVFFREEDDFDDAFEKLITTVDTDLVYVKAHTRYLTRAQEWRRENQRSDLLLFGEEIERAEAWLQKAHQYAREAEQTTQEKIEVVNPLPRDIQRDYISFSRQADKRRRRLVRSAQGSIVVLLAVLIVGAIVASQIVSRTQQEIDNIQGTSDRNVADANTQVGIADSQIATATRALVTATRVAQLEAEGQATLGVVNTQVADAIMTVTSAVIDQEITEGFANTMLQQQDNPGAQLAVVNRLVERYPQRSLAYQVRGLVYWTQENNEAAIEDYNQAIEIDPQAAPNYNNRGNAYRDVGEHEAAIADFNQAIVLEPAYLEAYNNRGNTYRDVGEYEAAVADYTFAITLNPQGVAAHYNRGNTYFDLGDFDAAIDDFTQAIDLDPYFVSAYNNRGIAYRNLGNYEAAFADFNQVIELDPLYVDAYYNRGYAYSDSGDYEAAIADYSKAIDLNPQYAASYYNRAIIYDDLDNHEAAIADYSKAIELNPQLVDAYRSRGRLYHLQNEFEAAVEDFTSVIVLDPNYLAAYFARTASYIQLTDYQAALQDINRALEFDLSEEDMANALRVKALLEAQLASPETAPEQEITAAEYINRGVALTDSGNYEAAIAEFDRAIELDSQNATAFYNRGRAYRFQREYERAIADYNRAIELDPEHVRAYVSRGLTYYDLDDLEAAISDYDQAVELDPDYDLAYYNRGLAYHVLGELQIAIDDYTRTIEINPEYANAYNNRGLAHTDLQDYEAAINDYDKLLELNPDYVFGYWNRGDALYIVGRINEALTDYLEYEQLSGQLEPHMAERIQQATPSPTPAKVADPIFPPATTLMLPGVRPMQAMDQPGGVVPSAVCIGGTEVTALQTVEIANGKRWVEIDCGTGTGWIEEDALSQ